MLDEWEKAADIKTYTDKYMRLNQTEFDLLRCVGLLRSTQGSGSVHTTDTEQTGQPGSTVLRITQGGSSYRDTRVSGGTSYQGNFAGYGPDVFYR